MKKVVRRDDRRGREWRDYDEAPRGKVTFDVNLDVIPESTGRKEKKISFDENQSLSTRFKDLYENDDRKRGRRGGFRGRGRGGFRRKRDFSERKFRGRGRGRGFGKRKRNPDSETRKTKDSRTARKRIR